MLLPWGAALAQTTTGSVRGYVTDEAGMPVSDATVSAKNAAMGINRGAATNEKGFYNLPGLRPEKYELSVRRIGFSAQTRQVTVLIGQAQVVDFRMSPIASELSAVVVTSAPVVETRTSEVATNVTHEQIEALPQQDRNFLSMALLAPGVTATRDEQNKQIKAGGLNASKINVFIDGASYKNEILEGGVHGQDASRGNPFPQLAIREFRVITQNFKAEYQRAASAVVTATTRSGTNKFQLDGFVLGQNRNLVGEDPGSRLRCSIENVCNGKPDYERLQLGASVGGALVPDKLFYFGGYEGNIQNRQAQVVVGRPEFRPLFAQYEGAFSQPFRSHLPFAKLTYQGTPNQTIDLSYNGRIESDKRNFGGTQSYESAENVKIGYHVVTLQHGWSRGPVFNQAHISGQRSTWNPTVVNSSQDFGQEFVGVMRIGARDTEQRFVQDRIALRNDLTYSGLQWAGSHIIKGGGNLDFLKYDVNKSLTEPYEAVYGRGNPGMSENNVQFGAFIQDDWDVTSKLQLNLGIRWDAETNQFNNKWVTPDSVRNAFAGGITPLPTQRFASFSPNDYFTRGTSDRPIFKKAFQPRVGFSFDVFGTNKTVLNGGFGIYYDREVWNRLLDERFRLQWAVLTFPFTSTNEANKIPWQSQYLSRAGLEGILAGANKPGLAEIFLLRNDTKPPKSHQFNFGVKQVTPFADLVVGATYRGVMGYNVFSWQCATPHSVHGYCEGLAEQGNPTYRGVITSTDEGRSWYNAVDLTAEKALVPGARWGMTFAYTLADGKRKGNDFFTLDYPGRNPADWPKEKMAIERHRINTSGIVELPADIQASTLIQWGSGVRYNLNDEDAGWGPARVKTSFASQEGKDFQQVDVRLLKNFGFSGSRKMGLSFEVINLFNHDNFREYEQTYRYDNHQLNPAFGRPQWWTGDIGRRLQIGLTVSSS